MAVSARFPPLLFMALLLLAAIASASPIVLSSSHEHHLMRRTVPLVTADNGTTYAIDPVTEQAIPQGPATDGSGLGFNAPALIWLVWSFAVGVPLALAGVKLWRLTTALSLGVAATVCVWAAFINSLGDSGISDLLLTVLAMGAFGFAFIVGLFNLGRLAGIAFLGLSGGFSVGARIALFRDGLLVPEFFVNWMICLAFGIIFFVLIVMRQRIAIIISSASVGTFLTALGIDLVVNKQKGMSTGLRFLFDRNESHLVDLFARGWHPPLSSILIVAISLVLIPILSYGQHKIFKGPFTPQRPPSILVSEPDVEVIEPLKEKGKTSSEDTHDDKTQVRVSKISVPTSMQTLLDKDGQPRSPPSPTTPRDEKTNSSRFST